MPKAKAKLSHPRRRDTIAVLLDEIRRLDENARAVERKMEAIGASDKERWRALSDMESALFGRMNVVEDSIRALRAHTLESALIQIAIVRSQLDAGAWSAECQEKERDACCDALASAAAVIEAHIGKSTAAKYLRDNHYLPGDCAANNTIN
jgi:hypothetical protein